MEVIYLYLFLSYIIVGTMMSLKIAFKFTYPKYSKGIIFILSPIILPVFIGIILHAILGMDDE